MIWLEVKTEGVAEPPYRYTCSRCGALWMTVEKRTPADLPDRCSACGETKTPSVTADTLSWEYGGTPYSRSGNANCGYAQTESHSAPPSRREAYGRSRTPAPTAVPEGVGDDG